MKKTISITPIGKPRMTVRDRWAKRPCVMRYRAFADELRLKAGKIPEDTSEVNFTAYFPMPKSWSKTKRFLLKNALHRQRPDVDNICKAILDALFKEDSAIARCSLEKRWDDGDGPRIELEIL